MRRVAVVVVLLAAGAQVTAGAALARTAPRLSVVERSPLVVRGAHFQPGERVTVKAPHLSRVVRTTARGTFRADLGTVTGDRCSMRIVATGARGDTATVLPWRALCAPAATP